MCARFVEAFNIAVYWQGAWSNFRVHSFIGSAPSSEQNKSLISYTDKSSKMKLFVLVHL